MREMEGGENEREREMAETAGGRAKFSRDLSQCQNAQIY